MRELGYVEGKNLVIEWRSAEGKPERLAGLAAELVNLKVDVIVKSNRHCKRPRAPIASRWGRAPDRRCLHAGVRCGAHQRKELERLCRYITRPAIANERLKRNGASDVVLQLKSAWRDGTTHIKMSPLEFMQRLAALLPRPRLHLIRFHGVLAPNAGLRAAVVPGAPEKPGDDAAHDAYELRRA
jgi:hypothetical protein